MNLTSENINELACALAKAQGEISSAIEDKVNPHFKSSYASLSSIWEACRLPLSKNGLAVIQVMSSENQELVLITTLAHSSGQWIKSILPISNVKATPQALGSAITYMRRYSLAAMVGVAPDDDDDGNQAQGPVNQPKQNKINPPIQPQPQVDQANEISGKEYAAFVFKHNLIKNSDGTASKKMQFVLETCEKTKNSENKIINAAIKNEQVFLERFEKWDQQRSAQIEQG